MRKYLKPLAFTLLYPLLFGYLLEHARGTLTVVGNIFYSVLFLLFWGIFLNILLPFEEGRCLLCCAVGLVAVFVLAALPCPPLRLLRHWYLFAVSPLVNAILPARLLPPDPTLQNLLFSAVGLLLLQLPNAYLFLRRYKRPNRYR